MKGRSTAHTGTSSVFHCGEATLTRSDHQLQEVASHTCGSWDCETCRPSLRRKLVYRLASGHPNKLLTLTLQPGQGETPDQMADRLVHAFQKLIKRIRRLHGHKALEYGYVIEPHASGFPHMHNVMRSNYVPHQWLCDVWEEMTGSKVVDIRAITAEEATARYLTKYLGKNPTKFGTHRRYGFSRGYEPADKDDWEKDPFGLGAWWKVQTPWKQWLENAHPKGWSLIYSGARYRRYQDRTAHAGRGPP